MGIVTNIYRSTIGETDYVRLVRVQDEETGEERLLEPHELEDPESVEIGDDGAYKVSLTANKIFGEYDTFQIFDFD